MTWAGSGCDSSRIWTGHGWQGCPGRLPDDLDGECLEPLLWEGYRAISVNRFGYSWLCDLYRDWAARLKPTLRQVHTAGERPFADFADQTMELIDGATGVVTRAEIFVAVLGALSFIYAEATASQGLVDWFGAHVNALAALDLGTHSLRNCGRLRQSRMSTFVYRAVLTAACSSR